MNLETMKSKIISVYNNQKWRDRVEHMDSHQVIAIYMDFEKRGKFSQPKTLNKGHKEKVEQYRQMTIFDYI